ncbi:PR domain zinc finger protein 5-like isoform X1 [Artemia franciscana]|uniref:PR domain zinc finger protein 5-like isoform X1 n=1 Tax=Artemia franciscana TaxID=6661 RepID=UPI0032DBE77F
MEKIEEEEDTTSYHIDTSMNVKMNMMDEDISDVDLGFDVELGTVQVIELKSDDVSCDEQELDDVEIDIESSKADKFMSMKQATSKHQKYNDSSEDGQSAEIFYRGNTVECDLCQACFPLKRDLRAHIKLCHPELRYRCNICDKEFKHEESMYRHRVNVHPVKEVVVESNVEVRSSSQTEVQETTIIETEIKSQQSGVDNVYIFECSHCKLQFTQQSDIEEHLSFVHMEDLENPSKSEISSIRPDTPGAENICDICKLCFLTQEDLAKHKCSQKQKQVFECGDCGKRFATERKVTRHLAVHQQFLCPFCNKMFRYNHVMRRHIRTCHASTSDTLYLCPGCDKTFGCPDQMKRHMLVHNTEDQKKFACDMCPMRFNYSHTLKRHKMGVHNLLPPEKLLSCEFCTKLFKSKDMLKRHYRSHTNERPYTCQHCERSFQFAFVLRRHMMTTHSAEMIGIDTSESSDFVYCQEIVQTETLGEMDHEVCVKTDIT